jgi:hypothetical protein
MKKDLRKALEIIEQNVNRMEDSIIRADATANLGNLRDMFKLSEKPMALKPFSQSDWYGYAGAEKFEDGSEPLIAGNDEFTIIVDKSGIAFDICFDDIQETYWANIDIANKRIAIDYADKLIQELDGMLQQGIVTHLREQYGLKVEMM